MNDHIKDYLLTHYFTLPNPQYAVMLKGKWGCGKTYFIKYILEQINDQKEKPGDSENIILKPIYISLNGLKTTNEISEKISAEIYPFLHSKFMKISKTVLGSILKGVAKIDLDLDGNDKNDGSVSLKIDPQSFFSTKDIKGKRILIFDDIERCSIPTNEIFGYINHFIEHAGCKVILLANEEKLDKEIPKENESKNANTEDFNYREIKEKLIGQTFEIKPNTEEVLKSIFREYSQLREAIDLEKHKNLIIDFFNASGTKNLRALKQTLLDFTRFVSLIDEKFQSNEKFQKFLHNLLPYFIIVSCELKSGNSDVVKFQSYSLPVPDKGTLEEAERNFKKTKVPFEEKFNNKLDNYDIEHSSNLIELEYISRFLKEGTLDKNTLTQEFGESIFFREFMVEDWEILWDWSYLKEEEFKKYKNKLWKRFEKQEVNSIEELLHLTGIFFELQNKGILEYEKDNIKTHAKKYIDKNHIWEKKEFFEPHFITRGAKGKQFQSFNNKEFQEIYRYLYEKNQKNNQLKYQQHIKNYLENINEENVYDINKHMLEITPDNVGEYNQKPIFNSIDINKLGENIFKLSNKGIMYFNSYVGARDNIDYQHMEHLIQDYHIEEKTNLEQLKNYLEERVPSKDSQTVKHSNIKGTIELLNKLLDAIKFAEAQKHTK